MLTEPQPSLAVVPVRWVRRALFGALAVFQVAGSFGASQEQPRATDIDALGVVLLVLGPLALATLWHRPRVALWSAIGISLLYLGLGYPFGPFVFTPLVALIHTVVAGHRAHAWIAGSVSVVGALVAHRISPNNDAVGWQSALGVTTWVVIVLVVGEVIRARFDRRHEARLAAIEVERRRASEERLLIAQELHDVLAHDISLINVQAGVGLHLMDSQPEQARAALGTIKHASKEALDELRAALDLLRHGERPPRAPTGGLDQLEGLVGRVRTPELDVQLERRGDAVPLPAGVDLAAFRIVQEALTNVVRHASGATYAAVLIDFGHGTLTVQVDDDGRAPSTRSSSSGSGITGMRERARVLAGDLQAGPRPGSGFRVRARFPLAPNDHPDST